MSRQRHLFGRSSEGLAAKFLQKLGYRILEKNHRNPLGEIDIIAREKGVIAFVEVKARQSDRYGAPKAAVTRQKQRRLSMAALHYLKITQQSQVRARFDVVAIRYSEGTPEIEIIRNAFELAYP